MGSDHECCAYCLAVRGVIQLPVQFESIALYAIRKKKHWDMFYRTANFLEIFGIILSKFSLFLENVEPELVWLAEAVESENMELLKG